MRHEHAAARVRRRIAEWVGRVGHGSKKLLAEAPSLYGDGHSASWVTDILDGPDRGGSDLRLKDLDAVAEIMGVQPGDLVRRNDNLYAEVTPSEMRFLRFYRSLPDTARHHLLGYFDYLYGMHQTVQEQIVKERDERTAKAKRVQAQERAARRTKGA